MKAESNSKGSTDLERANDRKWVIRKLCGTGGKKEVCGAVRCGGGWQVFHVKCSACCNKMLMN